MPTANKEKYIEQARQATAYFKGLGATRIVECWGDDVPTGEVTDFYKAVQAKEDETVTFSWIEYPDKATQDPCQPEDGCGLRNRHGDAVRRQADVLGRVGAGGQRVGQRITSHESRFRVKATL